MSEEQMYEVLGLPARVGLADEDEARYEWYIANHHALDLDPYAESEWTGGQQGERA